MFWLYMICNSERRGQELKLSGEIRLARSLEGRYSSGDIATGYGLDCPGIESRWERDFLHPSRPALWPTHNGYRVSPEAKAAGAWRWQPTPFGPSWPFPGRTLPLSWHLELFSCNFRWMIVLTTDNAYCGVEGSRERAASTVPVNWFGRLLLR